MQLFRAILALVGVALVCLVVQKALGDEPDPKAKKVVVITDDIGAAIRQVDAVLKIRAVEHVELKKVREQYKTDPKGAAKKLKSLVTTKNYSSTKLLAGLYWSGEKDAGVPRDIREALRLLRLMETWEQTGLELDELQGFIKEAESLLKPKK